MGTNSNHSPRVFQINSMGNVGGGGRLGEFHYVPGQSPACSQQPHTLSRCKYKYAQTRPDRVVSWTKLHIHCLLHYLHVSRPTYGSELRCARSRAGQQSCGAEARSPWNGWPCLGVDRAAGNLWWLRTRMFSSFLLKFGGLCPSLGAGHVVSRAGCLELLQALRRGRSENRGNSHRRWTQ